MSSRAVLANIFVIVAVHAAGASAAADDPVQEAWRLYLSADFDGALAAFDRAEAGTLDRSDVLRILEGRAQIHFALGDGEAVHDALSRLVSLSPDYRLSPETPPDLLQTFASMRESTPRIEIEVSPERVDDAVELRGRVEGDVGGVVRALRITGRVGGGTWSQVEDEPLVIDAARREAVEYYLEAIGAGGAVLLAEGSAERPRRVTADASGIAPVSGGGEEEEGLPLWAWIAIGGGALAAAGILVAVIAVAAAGGGIQAEAPVLP